MITKESEVMPVRGSAHNALSAFLGDWRAEGMSFGGTDQSGADPKANGVPWVSTHAARWHSGEFFLIQPRCDPVAERQPFAVPQPFSSDRLRVAIGGEHSVGALSFAL